MVTMAARLPESLSEHRDRLKEPVSIPCWNAAFADTLEEAEARWMFRLAPEGAAKIQLEALGLLRVTATLDCGRELSGLFSFRAGPAGHLEAMLPNPGFSSKYGASRRLETVPETITLCLDDRGQLTIRNHRVREPVAIDVVVLDVRH